MTLKPGFWPEAAAGVALALILFALAMLSAGCEATPMRKAEATNHELEVGLLTEFEGIRVYRFLDGGHYVYIAVSATQIRAEWQQTEGKATVHLQSATVR